MRAVLRLTCCVVAFLLCVDVAEAQPPTRLLQQSDLLHQGSFLLPDVQDSGGQSCFSWANGQIAFNPTNNSLFISGHPYAANVAEVTIPALGGVATMIQPCTNALEGRWGAITPVAGSSTVTGGLLVAGGKLIITQYVYYDASNTATKSHFVRSTNLSQSGTLVGPFKVGGVSDYGGIHSGYFTLVPAAWQAALGGALLNGACCRGIANNWSFGPSHARLDVANLLKALDPTPATKLIHYPASNAPAPWCDGTASPFYNGTTAITGAVLPEGTASLLFMGKHGTGPCTYTGGPNAPPYRPQVWAYDLRRLATVQAGAAQPWDAMPYATFQLPGLTGPDIGGVATDPATGRIFVSQNLGDGTKTRIHVFLVSGSQTPQPGDTIPPSASVTSPASGATVQVGQVSVVTAAAQDNLGVASVDFTVNGTVAHIDTTVPYSFDWTPKVAGPHTLHAVARDAAANIGTSLPVTVTASTSGGGGTPPPTPAAVLMTSSTTTRSGAVPLSGATVSVPQCVFLSPDSTAGPVTFTLDGGAYTHSEGTAPWDFALSDVATCGLYTFTAGSHTIRAQYASGEVTASFSVSGTVPPPPPPPSPTIVTVSTVAELAAAVAGVGNGQTIRLKAGTYLLAAGSGLFLPENRTDVTIEGATGNRADVVIRGGRFGIWFAAVTRLTVRNLTLDAQSEHGIIGNCGGEQPTLRNLVIRNSGDQFAKFNPCAYGNGIDTGLVEDSLFEYSTTAPDAYTNGVDIHGGDDWVIRRNTFKNFRAPGALAGPAILVWNGSRNTVVEENTFIDNARDIALGLIVNSSGTDHSGGRVVGNTATRAAGLPGMDVSIGLGDSPSTRVEGNRVTMAGTYPNAIEYRFPRTTGVVITKNVVDAAVVARDGACSVANSCTVADNGPAAPPPSPPPPPPVDAVLSDWSAWTPIGDWTVCAGGTQTRLEERTKTVVSPAQNGGWSPSPTDLRETRTVSRVCQMPGPTPQSLAAVTMEVLECRAVFAAPEPPDTRSGWRRQMYRRLAGTATWEPHGTVDSQRPYTNVDFRRLPAGVWEFKVEWRFDSSTATPVTWSLGTKHCPPQ